MLFAVLRSARNSLSTIYLWIDRALDTERPILFPKPVSTHNIPGDPAFTIDEQQEASRLSTLLKNNKYNWLIIDHYAFSDEFINTLQQQFSQIKICILDDHQQRITGDLRWAPLQESPHEPSPYTSLCGLNTPFFAPFSGWYG